MEGSVELLNLDNIKIKKPRKKKEKKIIVEEPIEEEPIEDIETNEEEYLYLRDKLLTLSDRNPTILTEPINTDYSLIDNMDLDEIKARIRLANRVTCSKLDSTVTKNVITLTNQVCGRLLGCVEELEASTQNDQLLHSTCKDYLGLNILDHIPTEIKLFGLYGSHVGASYIAAKNLRTNNVTEIQEE